MYYALHVSESWLVSAVAKRIYLSAALLMGFFFGFLVTITLAAAVAGGSLYQAPLLAAVLKGILFIGGVGTAVLWVGMWYFWFRYHPSNGMSKPLWASLFLIAGPVGSLIYFLLVYLRVPEILALTKQQAATA